MRILVFAAIFSIFCGGLHGDALEPVTEAYTHTTAEGESFQYDMTAGTLALRGRDGVIRAHMGYTAYRRSDVKNSESRPVTFAYNGGPGSASIWLHLGCLGPKIVDFPERGGRTTGPFELKNNPLSLLDVTDLVFVDPIGTGYSHAAEDEDPTSFWTPDGDAEAMGDFIHQFLKKEQLWNNPKFILGESYGTTRSALVSSYLQDQYALYLNGVVLISQVLDFDTLMFHHGHNLPYALYLPGYTAAAFHHGKLDKERFPTLEKALEVSEAFALEHYAIALLKGGSLSKKERDQLATDLHDLTGLPEWLWKREKFRITQWQFSEWLLFDEKDGYNDQRVGRFDSRYVGPTTTDPSYAQVAAPFSAGIHSLYASLDPSFGMERTYNIINNAVNRGWNWQTHSSELNVTGPLISALGANNQLQVFVAQGYFDLATPYFASDYTVNEVNIAEDYSDRITQTYYKAGHMMYSDPASHKKLREDLVAFYKKATQ